jgi:hypothetical protein
VNCPPARAKPKIIRRNAIPRRDFAFIRLSPGSSCLRSREAPLQRRSLYRLLPYFGRRCVGTSQGLIESLAYQIALQGVKHNISRTLNAVVVGDCRFALAEQVRIGCGAWVASPLQRDGEREGFFSTPSWRVKNPHLSPLPLPKGRGEKGWQVNFIYQS